MAADLQGELQEHEQRTLLADAIAGCADDIVSRWLARATADVAMSRVPLTDLGAGIREHLDRLSGLLRSKEPLDLRGASAWDDVARRHASRRVQLGLDASQLFHELILLRRVTSEVVEEAGHSSMRSAQWLTRLIDDAMKAALRSYIDLHDDDTRRGEAEHLGFLIHELKNPLGAATLAVDQLMRQQLAPLQLRLCEVIDRNLRRVQRLADEVLLAERLEAGEVESRTVDIPLGQLVEDSLATFSEHANRKQLGFATEYDPSVVLRVDPVLTLAAIEHLLDNAIKFTDAGTVRFAVDDLPSEVVFHVRDRCRGLSEDELRVVVEPFRRVRSSKPGTGLGLAIARRAVEAQGGSMHAESSAATGCHFWFSVPKMHH